MSKSAYSIDNIRNTLRSGGYVAIWFNGGGTGKSGQRYCSSGSGRMHWIGIIGYRNNNGKEQIFISDSAYIINEYPDAGWKNLDEFEACKGNIASFVIIK